MSPPSNLHGIHAVDSLLALPRGVKRIIAVLADASLCILTVWLSICLRYESWVSPSGYQWLAMLLALALALPLLAAFGFYNSVVRYAGKQMIQTALRAIGLYALMYSAIVTAFGLPTVPRTIGLLQPVLLLIGLGLVRLLAHQIFNEQVSHLNPPNPTSTVLIYGAGNSGQQLAASLQANGQTRVAGFLDDNISLHKARIAGITVHAPSDLHNLVKKHQVKDLLLAMPNLERPRRNEIIKQLSSSSIAVRTLPSLNDLAHGKISEGDLRELDIEDLLGRDPVSPIPELLRKNIFNKTVMVTGAGGSIGSELCRQILSLTPSKLILIEISEFALYQLNEELMQSAVKSQTSIVPVLADVQQQEHIAQIISSYRPQTIYHAAAYKHVPLVEANALAGLRNNILGTMHVAQAALAANVHDMVLISTDKAVRPTNIMGASKRIAEMVLQALAESDSAQQGITRFCMVRFGNVLDSSGSVIPRFRQQIKLGGPLTVTHPEVTRYFMTIPEAAQLVIQAAAMPYHNDSKAQVFLLDMGKSVKIVELARTLIQLSGLTVKDAEHPDGNIEIVFTGLRPGEKMYEELLVTGSPATTQHPKIIQSQEAHPTWDELADTLQALQNKELPPMNANQAAVLFRQLDTGYTPANHFIHKL